MEDNGISIINSLAQPQQFYNQAPRGQDDFSPDEIIIKVREGVSLNPETLTSSSPRLTSALKKHGASKADKLHKSHKKNNRLKNDRSGIERIFRIKVHGGRNIKDVVADLGTIPEIEYAEPNYSARPTLIPNDPYYSFQWGHNKINCAGAWDLNTGNNSIVVAVVDTGIERTHSNLSANMWTNTAEIPGNGIDDDGNGFTDDYYGWNFANDNNDTLDALGHGTHVSGIIGAVGNDSVGTVGVNWNVKMMPVRIFGTEPWGWYSDGIDGLLYAADNGADVINNSWGGSFFSQALEDAVAYAHAAGCVVVAAAGNDNTDLPFYPASHPHAISVGATDSSDQKTWFSNYGPNIDVVAPGSGILSTWTGGMYASASGTSMASPFVAGLAALIKANTPAYDNDQIEQAIITTAVDLGAPGKDNIFGYGRINALAALQKNNILKSSITSPAPSSIVTGMVSILGTSMGPTFNHYDISWGLGQDPTVWSSAGVTLTGGGLSPVNNGSLASLNTLMIPQDGDFTIRLRSYNGAGDIYEYRLLLKKSSMMRPGWPISLNYGMGGSHPTIADINKDGLDEIAVARGNNTSGGMYVLTGAGTVLPVFPVPFDTADGIFSSPAIGNMTGDANKELLFHNFQNTIKTVNSWGAILSSNSFGAYSVSSHPMVGDINADGYDEEVALLGNKLYAWTGGGSIMAGWPITLNVNDTTFPGQHATPGLADIDGDGAKEIVIALNSGEVHVFRANGTELAGWPKTGLGAVDWKMSSIAIADADGDNQFEIFMAFNNTIYGWKRNGTLLAGWPKTLPGLFQSALAIGNITGDARPEIVAVNNGSGDNLYAWDYQGNVVPGFPKSGIYSLLAGPIVADTDGDGANEITALNWFPAKIEMINGDGTSVPAFPFTAPSGEVFYDTPAVGDVDGDGQIELFVSGWDKVYCFDLPGFYNKNVVPWAMYNRDHKHQACIPFTGMTDPDPIIAGLVNDGLGVDIDYQTNLTTISANWSGFKDPNMGPTVIVDYRYAIGTAPNGTDVIGWTSVGGTANNFTRTGLALVNGTRYYVTIRAMSSAGIYSEVSSDGVLVDATAPAGTVNDGTAGDIDYQSITTSLSGNWTITDPQSGIVLTEISAGTTPGATDTKGWTDVTPATGYTFNSLSLVSGQTYYFNVRTTNNAGLTSTISSDGVLVDTTPPSGTVNDGTGADEDVTNSPDTLSGNWTITDPQSGIANYSYSIGTVPGSIDLVNWTNVGMANSFTRSGLTLWNGSTYYVNVRATNNAGVSSVTSSDGITVLVSPPNPPMQVNDGLGADIDMQLEMNRISGNWIVAPYAVKYWYAVGTSWGGTDVIGWTDNSSSRSFTAYTPLTLGQTYYVTVKSENVFGMQSVVNSSDGVLAGDLIPPTISSFNYNGNSVFFNVRDNESGINAGTISISIRNSAGQVVFTATGNGGNVSYDSSSGRVTVKHNLPTGDYTADISVRDNFNNPTSQTSALKACDSFVGFNYPNPVPFRNSTRIHFETPEDGNVCVRIYDMDGYLIKEVLKDGFLGFGKHDVDWDGTNSRGEKVRSGPYFCCIQLKGNDSKKTSKKVVKIMVL